MLLVVGDTHGYWSVFKGLAKFEPTAVIQVGDFGFYRHMLQEWKEPPFPVYAIDGNHEDHPFLQKFTEPTEVAKNLIYVPRGSVIELDGLRCGFLGGAFSIDHPMRKAGVDWFPDLEQPKMSEQARITGPIDVLFTHAPPNTVTKLLLLRMLIGPLKLDSQLDPSGEVVEHLYNRLGRPSLYCGHMHTDFTYDNITVLDINAVREVKSYKMGGQ